jgi:hypothetical protein
VTADGGATAAGGATGTGGVIVAGGTIAAGGDIATGGRARTGGTISAGGDIATGGIARTGGTIAAGGDIATGGVTRTGGTIGSGGTTSAGGAGGAGSTSSAFDANAFGQRYKFSNNELPGWTQPTAAEDPIAFDVYTGGDELVSRLDGGDIYTARGCRMSMFQDLVGPDPEICTVVAMDFVTSANANSMFLYQKSNGASVAIPGFGTADALASFFALGGMVAYAHFNALYFEVQLSGFANQTSAASMAAQFLGVFRSKAVGSAVPPTGWDQARIGNTGVGWWINAIKSAYFFSVKISPSSQDDTVGRAAVIGFAQEVVGGLTSGTPAPATLVPLADSSSGWMLDQNSSKTASGVAVATDATSATALIDGAADPFYDPTKSYQAKGLAWEVYSNGTYSLDLKVWQMASAANAAQLYTDLLDNSLYSNVTWTTCSGTTSSNPCPAQ